MATGQLMFEVGIQKAQGEYDKIYNEVMELAKKGKDGITINLAIKQSNELEAFLKVLKEFGSGKELQPLIDKVARLQDRLAEMSDKGQYLDRLKTDAKAATRELEAYEKRLAELDQKAKTLRSHNQFEQAYSKEREATSIRNSQEYIDARNRQQQAADRLAAAEERLSNATKTATQQESEAMNHLKQQVVDLTDKVRILQTALSKSSGAPITAPINIDLSAIEPTVKTINEAVNQLKKSMDLLWEATNRMEGSMKSLGGIEALEKIKTEAVSTKQQVDNLAKSVAGMSTQAEKKGSKSNIASITGVDEAQLNKVSSTAERFMRLLVEIENQMAKIGKIQLLGEQSGFSPTLLKNAQTQLDALKKMVESTIKGTPIAEGLVIPASNSQLAQFIQQFGLLKAEYRDIIKEADRFNKINEKDSLKQKNEELRAAASNMKEAANESRRLTETISNLEALASKAGALGIDTSKLRNVIDNLKGLRILMDDVAKTNSRSTKDLKLEERFFQLKRDIKDVAREIKKEMSAALKPDTEHANAFKEYISLLKQINSLTGTAKRAEALGIDTQTLRNQIALLENYAKIIERFVGNKGVGFNAWMQATPVYGEARGNIAADQAKMNKEIADAKQTNAHATNQLSESEQRLANAIKGSTDSMRGQSQVLSDLKMMAMQYLSVWGAQSFINNIIQTGGLLEQQRLSIGAILQNAGQATELFGKIKALAVQSPFGVVELDKMSKQLTAYGFEYKELYDWTKRLGDISAATGTGVDRLALALGHVRSEGALSGYTLRQFAMGNVPVLRMLSENLGISTKQVREKVRKKEISYEDVQNVLRQLTDEGGMFYHAQETMSQALNAKFKNLHDAFDIMYGEIAESGIGDALKRIAETLTAGAKEWGRYAKDLMGVAAAFGVAKAAMWAYNIAQAKNVNTSLNAVAVAAKQERENLRLAATYRELDAAEKSALGTKGALARAWYGLFAPMKLVSTEQLAVAISTKKLTQEELLRAVAMRKLNIEQAKAAILASKISRAQKAMMIGALNNVTVLGRWRIAMIGLGNAMKGVFSIAKTFAPLMAITAIMDIFARVSEMKDKAKEASSELAEKATSDLKVLGETFKELQDNGFIKSINSVSDKFINGKRVVSNVIQFDDSALNGKDLTQEINELKAKLQDMSPMYEGDLVDIDKMDNQVEQFKLIVRKLESIRHANDVTEAMSDVITDADVDIAGKNFFTRLFGDTYTQDVKDYESRLKDAEKDVNEINEQTIESIDKELGGQLENLRKKYSLDSKNSALSKLFSDWAKGSGLPTKYRDTNIEKYYDSVTKKAFSRSLSDQFSQMEADTKEMAAKLSSIVVTQFANDPDGAIYAVTNYIKKLMAMAGVTDPRVINEATAMMLDAMRKNLPQNLQTGVVDEMQRRILMEQFLGFLGNTITESTTPEEAEKALKKYSEMTIKWGEQMGIDLKKIGMDNAEAYRNGIEAKMNNVKIKIDWQKRASEVFVVNTVLKTNIDKSLDEFAQAVQKDLKAKQDFLARNKHHLKMTLNIDTDILMNADKLKAFMDSLAIQGQKKAMSGDWEGAQAIYSKIDKELKPYYDALVSVKEDKEWLKKEGYPETDPTKGNKKDPNTERAKAVREQVRVIKEAADAFQYWRDKVGDKGAWEHVQKEFGDVLAKIGITANNIEDVRGHLKKIPQMKEYQAITDKKVKTEIDKEIAKDNDQFIRKDFERDTKKYVSQLTLEIEELTRKWEIFNSVRNETGDSALAQRLTGITPGATPADLKRYNVASFAGVDIDFDSVLQMSDEQIDRYVEKLGVPEEKIEAIRNGLKDWKKAQKDIITSDIQNYAKWLGSLVDLQSIQTRNQNEYNQTLEETNRLLKEGKITQEEADRRKKSAAVTLDTKNWQSTMMYSRLYDNALMMATSEFNDAYAQEMKSLNDQMKAGTLTAKDYADKVSNLNEIAKEFSIDGFLGLKGGVGAFLSGGNDALIQYYNKRAKDARMRQAFYQQAGDKKNAKNSEDEAKKYEGLTVSLVKVTEGAKKVFTAFQGLSNGIDMVADLFANMGDSGTAETLGDVGSVFGSALSGASSLSMFGPYGMAAGAAIGLVSGIFALQDKSIQREIDALKENVAALEENTQSIKDYRQRTLGYDEGKIRKSMADTYITTIVDAYKEAVAQGHHFIPIMDSSQFAMAKYYATNYGMSGYQAELENLKALREDYRKMYKLEHSKKNVSDEALREYTKQIAELDEQIFYFTEDLANELWGIDFKAWASQISDALWTAFENGESALEAFHDTARDIISDVAKRMMNIHLIEPVFNKLEERLFGKIDENGVRTGGVYNETTGQFDENETLRILGEFFGEDGEFAKVVESAEDFYKMAERVTGFDLSDDGGSSSSSKTIKGITEQTADLLASYVSAIRLDVSVIRTMDAKVLQEYWPSQIRLMTAGTQSLTNIEQHTLAIMRSSDAIERSNQAILDNINGLKSKTWSIPIA